MSSAKRNFIFPIFNDLRVWDNPGMASATFLVPGNGPRTIADLVYNSVREFDRKGGRIELRAHGEAVIAWLITPEGRDDDFAAEFAVFNRYHRELVRQLENFGAMDGITERIQ